MTKTLCCEFFLLRYVPDLVKGEFVNFAVVLLDPCQDAGFAEVRFTRDWRRVKCLHPLADIEMLAALETDIKRRLSAAGDRATMLRELENLSDSIQFFAQVCKTSSPELEIERLAREYLEPAPVESERKKAPSARVALYDSMRSEFERAGVWSLMPKNIPVAQYTYQGDPLKLDCGYRPGHQFKVFHAVSLKSGIEPAEMLAIRYPRIREGIERREKLNALLTAVVEDDLDRNAGPISFALEAFEKSGIVAATLSELPRLAEVARRELRV